MEKKNVGCDEIHPEGLWGNYVVEALMLVNEPMGSISVF